MKDRDETVTGETLTTQAVPNEGKDGQKERNEATEMIRDRDTGKHY